VFFTSSIFLVAGLVLLARINTEKGTSGAESPGTTRC
jgi:hypothetical protein